MLALTAFPYAQLPNALLRELRSLAAAGLDLPLVDELAADIFAGTFSEKSAAAALQAADLLEDSLYAAYYKIDYAEVREICSPPSAAASTRTARSFWGRPTSHRQFAQLCARRAGVESGGWKSSPAVNGTVIEQQQILTTQNLATLVTGLQLTEALRPHLLDLSRRCFVWIGDRLHPSAGGWHADAIACKQAACAWRQMVFFPALDRDEGVAALLEWAALHLDARPESLQQRLRPLLQGLTVAVGTERSVHPPAARCFLGWSSRWLRERTGSTS